MAHLRLNVEVHTTFIFGTQYFMTVFSQCRTQGAYYFFACSYFFGCKLSITLDMRHNIYGALTNE